MNRRNFLKIIAASAAAEEEPTRSEFASRVPPEMNLAPAWCESLDERGEPLMCRNEDLRRIYMPVGGLTTEWMDINDYGWLVWKGVPGAERFAQRSTIRVNDKLRALRPDGFSQIEICGLYPIVRVTCRDSSVPVRVELAERRVRALGRDTWLDSSLPYWFLDRSYVHTSVLVDGKPTTAQHAVKGTKLTITLPAAVTLIAHHAIQATITI